MIPDEVIWTSTRAELRDLIRELERELEGLRMKVPRPAVSSEENWQTTQQGPIRVVES
jgi:hypothetical protein